MDREQEALQFLGFFGIIKESIKLIFTRKKIFTQITLSLILPLTFIFLAHIQISDLIFNKIVINTDDLSSKQEGSPEYSRISDSISIQWVYFWLFKFVYFTFLLIFSLLSTSAVVYTIACVYTAKEISYKKVMKVVPKVWKRLMVTFIWNFVIVFVYNVVTGILIVLAVALLPPIAGLVIVIVLLLIYLMGIVYISLIWQLASVVSVLEDLYGLKAMGKSKELIKGKMGISFFMFLLLVILNVGIESVFRSFGVIEIVPIGLVGRIGIGILCLVALVIMFLFGLVIQTVIYFVCKSYHHQIIDRSLLADHLEGYLGDYVPLNPKNVQLQEYDV